MVIDKQTVGGEAMLTVTGVSKSLLTSQKILSLEAAETLP